MFGARNHLERCAEVLADTVRWLKLPLDRRNNGRRAEPSGAIHCGHDGPSFSILVEVLSDTSDQLS